MKGLLLKDLLNLKKACLPMLLFLGVYFVISLVSGNSAFFTGIAMVFCAMIPISAMSYDERAGFTKYALTMPVSRKMVVVSRYLLALVLIGFSAVLSFIANAFIGDLLFLENIISVLSIMFVAILMVSLSLPPIFKYGVEKGRIITIAMVILIAGISSFAFMGIGMSIEENLFFIGDTPILIESSSSLIIGSYLVLILALVCTIVFLCSMSLSIKIYNKKDF